MLKNFASRLNTVAIHIAASKCPSVTLVRSLDLLIFMIEKACSQQYVLANRETQILTLFNNTGHFSYSSQE